MPSSVAVFCQLPCLDFGLNKNKMCVSKWNQKYQKNFRPLLIWFDFRLKSDTQTAPTPFDYLNKSRGITVFARVTCRNTSKFILLPLKSFAENVKIKYPFKRKKNVKLNHLPQFNF